MQSTDTLKLVVSGQSYNCLNSATPADCKYEALDATSPAVTSVTVVDDTTLTFAGTLLSAADGGIDCNLLGVTGTGVSSNSDTTVTCTFEKGVPAANNPAVPTLVFHTTAGSLEDTALTGGATITKSVGRPTSKASQPCSF